MSLMLQLAVLGIGIEIRVTREENMDNIEPEVLVGVAKLRLSGMDVFLERNELALCASFQNWLETTRVWRNPW